MELQQDTFLLPIPHGKRVRTVLHPSMKQSEAEQWFRSEPAERARQVAGLQAVFRRDAAVAGAARAAPKHRVLHESGRLAPCQRHGARPACVLVVAAGARRGRYSSSNPFMCSTASRKSCLNSCTTWPAERTVLRQPGRQGIAFQNLTEHVQGNHLLGAEEIAAAFAAEGFGPEIFLFSEGQEAVIVARKK